MYHPHSCSAACQTPPESSCVVDDVTACQTLPESSCVLDDVTALAVYHHQTTGGYRSHSFDSTRCRSLTCFKQNNHTRPTHVHWKHNSRQLTLHWAVRKWLCLKAVQPGICILTLWECAFVNLDRAASQSFPLIGNWENKCI